MKDRVALSVLMNNHTNYPNGELIGAVNSIADARYLFRLITPAFGKKEYEALRRWHLRISLLSGAFANRAELESYEAIEEYRAWEIMNIDPVHNNAQNNAQTFFSLLYEGWGKWKEGRQINQAILEYFGNEDTAAKLFIARRSVERFQRYVEQAARIRVSEAIAGASAKGRINSKFGLSTEIQEILDSLRCVGGPYEVKYSYLLDRFLEIPKLAAKAKLIPTKYLTIVQEWYDQGIVNPVSALILECAKHPDSVYKLTGRQFEHLVAEIFREFKCDVELTVATRDQGRDIICCRQKGSRQYKFAIETKRYARNRKITVGLINQFLGANRKFDGDRLLFVTTSDYTKPALKQARDNIDILSVRNFNDVIFWANQYSDHALGISRK